MSSSSVVLWNVYGTRINPRAWRCIAMKRSVRFRSRIVLFGSRKNKFIFLWFFSLFLLLSFFDWCERNHSNAFRFYRVAGEPSMSSASRSRAPAPAPVNALSAALAAAVNRVQGRKEQLGATMQRHHTIKVCSPSSISVVVTFVPDLFKRE